MTTLALVEGGRIANTRSGGDARGSAADRRRRKIYLLSTYESIHGPGTAQCYRCPKVLTFETLTVDRIVPGVKGGTYRRSNIRPACSFCNSSTGASLRGKGGRK